MQEIRNMPVGIQSFEIMREGGYVYVDKTQFIPQLEKIGRAYFLTRPRRFGKSLFVSTLKAYFEGRSELFKGLSIERIKARNKEAWQKHPVLKLDLNSGEYTKEENLVEILNEHIKTWKREFGLELDVANPSLAFSQIIKLLYKKFGQRVVFLVDEYDKPLIATLDNTELNNYYRSLLKAFYSVIKSENDYLHLSFLTGVTKFSKVSIFSDLNNLSDISFDSAYSAICGITETELTQIYSPEIDLLAKKYNTTHNAMLSLLRTKYDGYRFSEKEERIYNPFSICNAFDKQMLGEYWFETGTPTFLVHVLERQNFNIADLEGNIKITLDNLDAYKVADERFIPLLFQTGYITIKGYDAELNRYLLGFPNDEVKYAFLKRLLAVYTRAQTEPDGAFVIDEFLYSMRAGDIERVLNLIKALIASIPYDSFSEQHLDLREQNYQATIYIIFRLLGQYIRCEVHSHKGRSDAEVETSNAIYIFEFKIGGEAKEAMAHIKNTDYAQKYITSPKSIFLIGATISKEKRTLDAWQIEKVK